MPDVTVRLAGEAIPLACTAEAAKSISGYFGSLVDAYQRVAKFDVGACSAVVAFALGKTRADVEAPVFEAGLETIVPDLLRYLVRLTNGGREPTPAVAAEPEKET